MKNQNNLSMSPKIKKTISVVLVLSFFTGSFSGYSTPVSAASMDSVKMSDIERMREAQVIDREKAEMAKALEEFDGADDNSMPKKTKDIFSLSKQYLTIHSDKLKTQGGLPAKGQTFSMMADLAPLVIATDFENQVKFTIDNSNKSLNLEYWKNHEHMATQTIYGFDVVTGARDKEFYTFLDRSGKIYTIDTGLARDIVFRAPIPVLEVAEMDPSLVNNNLKATYRTRGGLPNWPINPKAVKPEDLTPDSTSLAGSFDLYDPVKREYVGIYVRQGLRVFTYLGESLLNMLAIILNPAESQKYVEAVHKEAGNAKIQKTVSQIAANADPALRALIRSLPDSTLDSLTKRMKQNKAGQNENLDKFTGAENEQARAMILKIMEEERKFSNLQDADVGKLHREYLDKEFNPEKTRSISERLRDPKALKIMAAVVAGAMTVGAAYAAWKGVGPAWAVNFIHNAYDLYIPKSVKTTGYNVRAILSALNVYSYLPLLFVIGASYNKIGNLGMNAVKATAKLGMFIWGTSSLFVFHSLAKWAKWPNFVKSMQYGFNPFGKVDVDGKSVRPGINVPNTLSMAPVVAGAAVGATGGVPMGILASFFGLNVDALKVRISSDEKYKEITERNSLILKQMYDKRNRQKAMSQALAVLAVGQAYGIDPVTIVILEDGAFTPAHLEKMATDLSYRKLWDQTRKELEATLVRLQAKDGVPFDKDFSEIDPVTFNIGYELATKAVKDIKSRPAFYASVKRFIPAWNDVGRRLLMGTSRFGVEQSNYLKNADPSDFVVKQFFLQFTVDYTIGVPQITFTGTRANFDDIGALAAKPTDAMIQDYMQQHPDYVWNKAAETVVDSKGHMIYNGSNYFAYTNPQQMASMLDQVRIYGINVPSSTALNYDKYQPVSETMYAPIDPLQYKEMEPRREKLLESIWNFSHDIFNLKKAQYAALWLKQNIRRFQTIQGMALFSLLIERLIMAGQPFEPAFYGLIYAILSQSIKGGMAWDPVQKGMQMRDERLEAALEKITDVKTRLSQAIRFDQDREMAEAYKQFVGYYKDSKTDLPTEIDTLLPAIENFINEGGLTMLPELKKQVQEKGVALLQNSKVNPAVATKENAFFNWGAMTITSLATTFWLIAIEVDTYHHHSWPEKIASALTLFLSFYSSTHLFEKFILRSDSRSKEIYALHDSRSDLEKNMKKGNKQAAENFLRLTNLYKAAEKPLPPKFKEFEAQLTKFLAGDDSKMSPELKDYFIAYSHYLLELSKTKKPYETDRLFDKAVTRYIEIRDKVAVRCPTVMLRLITPTF